MNDQTDRKGEASGAGTAGLRERSGGRLRAPSSAEVRPVSASGASRPRAQEGLITGRLMAHGAAKYQFRRDQEPSYYLKLLTNAGERVVWGKDLDRAIKASATQVKVGDMVGARRTRREAVTITQRQRDAQGRIVSQSEHQVHRNRWVVEKVTFFADRARMARRLRDEQLDAREAVRTHPELASAFLSLRAATELAERKIADPDDRKRFMALVRDAMAGSIHAGEPLPSVKLRNAVRAPVRRSDDLQPKRTRNERTR